MLLNKQNVFVVYGAQRSPEVHMLDSDAVIAFRERVDIAERRCRDPQAGRLTAYRQTFGDGAEYAIPCTSAALEFMALQYVGPQSTELKALCARILLGQLIGDAGKSGQPPSGGGQKAVATPKQPRKPRPGGAAVVMQQQEGVP